MNAEAIKAGVKKERPTLQYVRELSSEEVLEGIERQYLFKKYGTSNIPVENRRGIFRFKNGRKLNQLQAKNYNEKLDKNERNLGTSQGPKLLFQGTEGFLKKKPFYVAVFENVRTGTLLFEQIILPGANVKPATNKRGNLLVAEANIPNEEKRRRNWLSTIQKKSKPLFSKPNLPGFRATGPAQRAPPPRNFRNVPAPSISSANALLARASMTNEQRKANQSVKRRAPAGARFSLPNLRGQKQGLSKMPSPLGKNWRKYTPPGTPKLNTRLANTVIAVVSQALMTAKTPAAAKAALRNQPPVVQRQAVVAAKANVTPAVAKAMNPSILAKAITDLISAGITKIPAPAAAAALTAPAPVAKKVAEGMDSTSLSAAILEMVRQGIKPPPAVVAAHPEPAKIITNSGNLSKQVAKIVMNALPKAKLSVPQQAAAIHAAANVGVTPPPTVIAPVLGNKAAAANVAKVTPPPVLAASILNAISRGLPVHPAAFGQNPAQVATQLPTNSGRLASRVAAAVGGAFGRSARPAPQVVPAGGLYTWVKNKWQKLQPGTRVPRVVENPPPSAPPLPEFGVGNFLVNQSGEPVVFTAPSAPPRRNLFTRKTRELNRRPLKNFIITNEKNGNRTVRRAKYKAAWRTLGVPPMPNNGNWIYNARTKTWTQNKGAYQGANFIAGNEPVLGTPAAPPGPTVVLGPNGQPQGIAVPQRQANAAARQANSAAQRARQAAQTAPTPEVKKAAEKANNEAQKAKAAAQRANAAVGTNAANNEANKARRAAANAANAAAKAAQAAANAKPNNKKAANATKAANAAAKATGGSSTITFSPNIKIQLGNLAKAAEAAKANPNKQPNLEKLLANLRSKLPANSQTLKTVNNLFKEPNKIPTANQVKKALAKSYSNMNINELIALRKTGKNKDKVEAALREQVQTQLRRIGRLGSSERGPMLAALYKTLPESFKSGRSMIERNLKTEIREASRRSNGRYRLENLRRNFGSVLPSSLRNEYRVAESRALREDRGRSPYNRAAPWRVPTRQAPLRQNYLRQAPRQTGGFRLRGEAPLRERIPENKYSAMRQEGALPLNTSAPLPPNQRAAINQAGGHAAAVHTIAAVPGGAPRVAMAAQALNEANGNRAVALERGADPVALNAVVKLSGKPANSTNAKTLKAAAKNASYVIEGLHHSARAHKARKTRKPGVNLNALNNVINAVRKKKLVSIVAHKVTKTNNIHENENRKKKAYKSLIKSKILKGPLANIARRAAKKRTAKK